MSEPSAEAIQRVWTVSLIVFAVVLAVVAALLTLILREARRIQEGVTGIWNVGQAIANNTIHVALLDETNHVARRILASAGAVAGATAALAAHAEGCAGCPDCVLGAR